MSLDLNEAIGAAAGQIWSFLSENGQTNLRALVEGTGLDRNDAQRAIGWLAREGKLVVERKGKNELFSLNGE